MIIKAKIGAGLAKSLKVYNMIEAPKDNSGQSGSKSVNSWKGLYQLTKAQTCIC